MDNCDTHSGQQPPGADDFDRFDAYSNFPALPVILLLDISGSMTGNPINELNKGFRQFIHETKEYPETNQLVELEVISFNDTPHLEIPFQRLAGIDENALPVFTASENTALGAALDMGLETLQDRRDYYRRNGIPVYKPWFILMTDGVPTDDWMKPARKLLGIYEKQGFKQGFNCLGIGVGDNVDWHTLRQIVPDPPGPIKLRDINFHEFFSWTTRALIETVSDTFDFEEAIQSESIKTWADLDLP